MNLVELVKGIEAKYQAGQNIFRRPSIGLLLERISQLEQAAQQSVQATGLRRCPACHALLEEHSVYCDTCGTDTPRR